MEQRKIMIVQRELYMTFEISVDMVIYANYNYLTPVDRYLIAKECKAYQTNRFISAISEGK